jgi:hypothetical protein
MKVKIFTGLPGKVEREINSWLEQEINNWVEQEQSNVNNPIVIHKINQSESLGNGIWTITISIFYENNISFQNDSLIFNDEELAALRWVLRDWLKPNKFGDRDDGEINKLYKKITEHINRRK